MPDVSPSSVGSFLSILRTLPVWMLSGLALAGYAVLFVPAFGGVDPTGFRHQWGIWVWIESLSFSILAVTRGLDAAITGYRLRRKTALSHLPLRLIPLHQQCWWHLAKQQDDTFVSQIRLDIEAANLTDRPVRIVKVRLIRPKTKGEVLHAEASLPLAGSPYHSSRHAVPPHDTVTAALHLMVRGILAHQGKSITVTLGITDQFGDEYRLKGIIIRTHDPLLPKRTWTELLASSLRAIPWLRPESDSERPLPAVWQHGGEFEEVDLILNEERRAYAAHGRIVGGLGSLNVELQSDPPSGGTTGGKVPTLLWDKAHAKLIDSPDVARLMKLKDTGKVNLEGYLLSHLHKRSPYADVAYAIFLALHRMDRTIDALAAARAHLAGDKVYGYSNLLGTLSAIVSYEHFDIDPALYPRILQTLEGDTEHNFRLNDKINQARLQHLDLTLTDPGSQNNPEQSTIP